jgi:syntaxin 6
MHVHITQGRMLDSLDEDLTDATEKMGFVMGNMAKLLKTKDKFQIWTIAILAVILIILVFLVIYS